MEIHDDNCEIPRRGLRVIRRHFRPVKYSYERIVIKRLTFRRNMYRAKKKKKIIGLNNCQFSIVPLCENMIIIIFSDRFITIQYVLVIWSLSPHVRHAVDAEGYVQIYAVAEIEVYPE